MYLFLNGHFTDQLFYFLATLRTERKIIIRFNLLPLAYQTMRAKYRNQEKLSFHLDIYLHVIIEEWFTAKCITFYHRIAAFTNTLWFTIIDKK